MKWVIAFQQTNKTTLYLNKELSELSRKYKTYNYGNILISFTKHQRKIPHSLLFNTKEEAQAGLAHHIYILTEYLRIFINANKNVRGLNISKYFIEEYDDTQFDFVKSRKTMKFEWTTPKHKDIFCGNCGMQIKTKYLKSRYGKICPICILNMSYDARHIINEELKQDSEFLAKYKVTRFLGEV
jgi:hypothetical protein